MKVCMCRDFDEAAVKKVIEEQAPKNPEDLHRILKNILPDCGTCLGLIQTLMDEFAKTGQIPNVLKVTAEDRKPADLKLGERFAAEEADTENKRDIPAYKRRYIVLHNRKNKIPEPA